MLKKILVLMFGCFLSVSSVYANSSQKWFKGADSTGVVMSGEVSPIVVKHEKLIFDIHDFPQSYYHDDKNNFLAYDASVSAQYEFYNPTDYTIEARLMFPFGNLPDYSQFQDENYNRIIDIDNKKYKVTINNEEVKSTIRHTFKYSYQDFSLEDDLSLLVDGYKEDTFYSLDLPITKYIYSIDNVDNDTYKSAFVAFTYTDMSSRLKFYMENLNGYDIEDHQLSIGSFVDDQDNITLYVIGEDFKEDIKWNLYDNAGKENMISGDVTLVSKTNMKFEDLAMQYYNEESGILKSDWYNAIVDMLNRSSKEKVIHTDFNISEDLLRWYDYTIVLSPKETIINTVTAPMYPSIDTNYEPPIYEYIYLLSPARTWKEFGHLDIEIRTPYKMISHNIDEYEKTDSGYVLSLDTLPLDELEFSLSTVENPSKVTQVPVFVSSAFYYICIPIILIVGLFVLLKRGNKKK